MGVRFLHSENLRTTSSNISDVEIEEMNVILSSMKRDKSLTLMESSRTSTMMSFLSAWTHQFFIDSLFVLKLFQMRAILIISFGIITEDPSWILLASVFFL
jgi:hypothetical protein